MRRLSLRIKIILSIILPLIVALCILTFAGFSVIDAGVEGMVAEQQTSIAEMISYRMDDNLKEYSFLIHSLIHHPSEPVDSLTPDQILGRIEIENIDLVFDQGIALYDGSGELIRHKPESSVFESQISPGILSSLSVARTWYYSPLNTDSMRPYISLYIPLISDEKGLLYVFEGRASPEYSLFGADLVPILELREGTTGYAVLIDQSGNILYQRFVGELYDGIDGKLVEQHISADRRESSSFVFQNKITGKKEYAGYSPVADTGWGIIAREDRDVLFRVLNSYYLLAILLIIATGVVICGLVIWVTNSNLTPLSQLVSRIREIEQGNLELVPVIETDDELGTLTSHFNQMVSSLKASFDSLDTARRRYLQILDQSYDGVVIVRKAGFAVVESNRMAREITGYSEKEMRDRDFSSLIHESDRDQFIQAAGDLSSDGSRTEMKGVLIRKDRMLIHADIALIQIRIDEKVKIQVTIRDTTEKVAAEEKSRKKTEELDRFFSLNLDLLAILDCNGRFMRVNPEWVSVTGYPKDELTGMAVSALAHPDDISSTEDSLEGLPEEQSAELVNRIRCRDGSYRWIEWRLARHGDQIYGAARDTTGRKEAEQKIEAGVQMLSRNQETLATLNDQIRNPLSIIYIYSENCDEEIGDKIRNEVMRIDGIIDRLDNGWVESDKVRRVMQKYFNDLR